MNRAAPIRIGAYNQLTSLGMNVVAIDYRGFGDSEGQPTEEGVLRDARAAYRWIVERQQGAARLSRGERLDEITDDVFAGQILLSGQSLGTGVASRLTLDLVEAGERVLPFEYDQHAYASHYLFNSTSRPPSNGSLTVGAVYLHPRTFVRIPFRRHIPALLAVELFGSSKSG